MGDLAGLSALADWLPVSVPVLVALVCAAGFAGWVDAVVGGGGLIQLPALVIGLPSDVPTASVLGTNKLSAFAGTCTASIVYLRKVGVQAVLLVPLVAGAFGGSAVGAWLSRQVPREVLTPVVLVAVLVVGWIVVRRPTLGLEHAPRYAGASAARRTGVVGAVVGMYDGLLGPGTGSFFVIALVVWLGLGFLQASVHAKLANLTTNVAALLVYGVHGELLLVLGGLMAAANITGGLVGARMAVRHGNAFIRRVFLLVMAILAMKLGWDTVVWALG